MDFPASLIVNPTPPQCKDSVEKMASVKEQRVLKNAPQLNKTDIQKAWWYCSNVPKWPLFHKIIFIKIISYTTFTI